MQEDRFEVGNNQVGVRLAAQSFCGKSGGNRDAFHSRAFGGLDADKRILKDNTLGGTNPKLLGRLQINLGVRLGAGVASTARTMRK